MLNKGQNDIVIASGKNRIRFDSSFFNAPAEWSYGDTLLFGDSGYNGTVFAPVRSDFVGVGHVEGGREEPLFFDLERDGSIVKEINGVQSGEKVTVLRITKLLNFQLAYRMELCADGVVATSQLLATDSQSVSILYCHQYSWTVDFDRFFYIDLEGKEFAGEFPEPEIMLYWGKLLCGAVYNSKSKVAVVFAPDPASAGVLKFKLWDRICYHKLYAELDFNGLISQGDKTQMYTLRMMAFPAAADEWQDRVRAWKDALPAFWDKWEI